MDILYIFNYQSQHLKDALTRFRYSLSSLADQGARICVSNNSESCIYPNIKDIVQAVNYIHKPYKGKFSRAHGINFGVRSLVRSEYFMISDVDLIYRSNHLSSVKNKMRTIISNSKRPIRLVFWNYNMEPRYQPAWMNMRILRRFAKTSPLAESSDYETLALLPNNGGDFAHGNGIIHLESFIRIRGYDEEMIGYGPEDDLFNTRISKVNDIIYDNDVNTATIHLWHKRLQLIQYKKNMGIWKERKAFYEDLKTTDWNDVIANKHQSNWGEIS